MPKNEELPSWFVFWIGEEVLVGMAKMLFKGNIFSSS
jgi:hypothetical protein